MFRFQKISPIVLNLIIICALFFFGTSVIANYFSTDEILALHYFKSSFYNPYQYLSYIFMHGGFTHLLFNMFALYVFGSVLEIRWGSKKFLFYFLVTGIGAGLIHTLVTHWRISSIQDALIAYSNTPSPDAFMLFMKEKFSSFYELISRDSNYLALIDAYSENPDSALYADYTVQFIKSIIQQMIDIPVVGASGSVFGILLAFGMTFPNVPLMIIPFPFPIKAKYLVIGYGAIELYSGVLNQPGDNVAHFAHLGGMIFGFILLKIWGVKSQN